MTAVTIGIAPRGCGLEALTRLCIGEGSTCSGAQRRKNAKMKIIAIKNMQASKDLIAALAELSKKCKTSKKSSKKSRCPVKSKIRKMYSEKSRCPIRLQMQHTKEEEEDILRLIDEDRGERTPSSSHSWMHEDVQDLDEATQSSSHSWMHEEDAAPKLALRSLDTSATPSSPHSWMHDEVASPELL